MLLRFLKSVYIVHRYRLLGPFGDKMHKGPIEDFVLISLISSNGMLLFACLFLCSDGGNCFLRE